MARQAPERAPRAFRPRSRHQTAREARPPPWEPAQPRQLTARARWRSPGCRPWLRPAARGAQRSFLAYALQTGSGRLAGPSRLGQLLRSQTPARAEETTACGMALSVILLSPGMSKLRNARRQQSLLPGYLGHDQENQLSNQRNRRERTHDPEQPLIAPEATASSAPPARPRPAGNQRGGRLSRDPSIRAPSTPTNEITQATGTPSSTRRAQRPRFTRTRITGVRGTGSDPVQSPSSGLPHWF